MAKYKFSSLCGECGEDENDNDHHPFVPIRVPASCVCDPFEFRDAMKIPDLCAGPYVEDETTGACKTCNHESGCHPAPATPNPEESPR